VMAEVEASAKASPASPRQLEVAKQQVAGRGGKFDASF
jgi:hypothetical protein